MGGDAALCRKYHQMVGGDTNADLLTGHGIRATISTALNELGYPKEWIEVQLSHADPNKIRAAYNHADYVEQRRMMMQDWADHLVQWRAAAHERP